MSIVGIKIQEGHPDHCSLCKKRYDDAIKINSKRAEAAERFKAVRKEPAKEKEDGQEPEPEVDCLHWFEAGFLFGD